MLDGVLVERDRTLGMPATTSSSAQTASTVNTTTAAHRSRSRLAVVVEQALTDCFIGSVAAVPRVGLRLGCCSAVDVQVI